MEKIKIGIIIADDNEFTPLQKMAEQFRASNINIAGRPALSFSLSGKKADAQLTAVLCGVGKVNATVAATALAEQGVHIILNCGLSGGISGISRNELCLPDRFIEHDFDLQCLGYDFCQKPGQEYIYEADRELLAVAKSVIPNIKTGMAATGDCFVQNVDLRNKLRDKLNAVCCDMETAAIAYVCKAYKIKFLSVRKISDDAGESAGNDYRQIDALAEDDLVKYLLAIIEKLV